MRTIKYFLALPFILLCFFASAQVRTNFNNDVQITNRGRFIKAYKGQIDFEIPAKNNFQLLEIEKTEIEKSNQSKPFQLAVPVAVDLNIAKLANWTYEDDFAFGKFTIKLNGALSASINFDQFFFAQRNRNVCI